VGNTELRRAAESRPRAHNFASYDLADLCDALPVAIATIGHRAANPIADKHIAAAKTAIDANLATAAAAEQRELRTVWDRITGADTHVHFPIGGQGLNTGVQDAMNLGWKLAQVVNGTSPDTLLVGECQTSGTLMFSWILSDTLRSFWTPTLGLVQKLLRASRSQDRPTIKMFWIGHDLRKGESNPRKHESCPDLLDFLRLVDS
jgi:hypothetical protein